MNALKPDTLPLPLLHDIAAICYLRECSLRSGCGIDKLVRFLNEDDKGNTVSPREMVQNEDGLSVPKSEAQYKAEMSVDGLSALWIVDYAKILIVIHNFTLDDALEKGKLAFSYHGLNETPKEALAVA